MPTCRKNSQPSPRRTVKVAIPGSKEKKVLPVRELLRSKREVISKSVILKKKGNLKKCYQRP